MSYLHLTLEERYVIYHLALYGLSYREIAHRLNRHHTTINRKVERNRPTYADSGINASAADRICGMVQQKIQTAWPTFSDLKPGFCTS